MPRLVLISDTHNKESPIPHGDILVHAGDLTMSGTTLEITAAGQWLREQPHATKIVCAGNHDWGFQETPELAIRALGDGRDGLTYLRDSGTTALGLKFYASPWQPYFCNWAFNLPRGKALAAVWKHIPGGLDVLVTHGPPRGILDRVSDGRHEGCDDLLKAVEKRRPRLHVFGHIHEAHGLFKNEHTTFVNASIGYRREHRPVVLDMTPNEIKIVSQ